MTTLPGRRSEGGFDPHGGHAVGRISAKPIGDPAPNASFGAIGCFLNVTDIEPKGSLAMLSIKFDPANISHVDATTLAWYRIDLERQSFELVDSYLDVERRTVGAPVRIPGIYGVYGLPKHPALMETVRLLFESFPLIRRELERGTDRTRTTICELILCAPPWGGGGDGPAGLCAKCLGLEILKGGLPEFEPLRRRPQFGVIDPQPDPPKRPANGRIVCALYPKIVSLQPDGTGLQDLAVPTGAEFFKIPAWSRDGARIAFSVASNTNPRIEVMNADGTGRSIVAQGGSTYGRVRWTPDGTEVVFNFSPATGGWQIDAVRLDGSGRRQLVANAVEPAWSPDGKYLAFIQLGASGDIYVSDRSVAMPSSAVLPGSGDALALEWAQSGRFLLVKRVSGGSVEFYVFPMNGGTPAGPPISLGIASHSFDSASLSPLDDRLVGYVAGAPGRIWVADFDAGKALAGQPAVTNIQYILNGDVLYPTWQIVYV